MRQHPFRTLVCAAMGCAVIFLLSAPAIGQTPGSVTKTAAAAKVSENKAWTAPHLPDGTPDLQGVWSNATNIPLEKPRQAAPARPGAYTNRQANGDLVLHYDNAQFGLDRSRNVVAEDTREYLVTTPDGHIPALVPEAQKRIAERAAFTRDHQWDGPETRPLGEQCIMWPNEGPPMLSEGYNSNLQIAQGPGYVAIMQEMIHDVRIIPTDGRPHIASDIRQWFGNSTGHWEGNTLVVDTTNFTDKVAFQRASENLHVIERITRVADDKIQYEFTVEDPHTWAEPWGAKIFWEKESTPIYEYACHEGNYGMRNNLSARRAMERKAEEAAKKEAK